MTKLDLITTPGVQALAVGEVYVVFTRRVLFLTGSGPVWSKEYYAYSLISNAEEMFTTSYESVTVDEWFSFLAEWAPLASSLIRKGAA